MTGCSGEGARAPSPDYVSRQAARWPAAVGSSAGSWDRHASNASGQRGWNLQPLGMRTAWCIAAEHLARVPLPRVAPQTTESAT
jgi:hypothetical protein